MFKSRSIAPGWEWSTDDHWITRCVSHLISVQDWLIAIPRPTARLHYGTPVKRQIRFKLRNLNFPASALEGLSKKHTRSEMGAAISCLGEFTFCPDLRAPVRSIIVKMCVENLCAESMTMEIFGFFFGPSEPLLNNQAREESPHWR